MNFRNSVRDRIDVSQLRDAASLPLVEHHDEIESTNDRALRLVNEDAARLPALIVAERQTTGRGRGRNTWWSGVGALTFSLIVAPESHGFAAQHVSCVSLVAGLAVVETLRALLPAGDFKLKWPNDVFLRSRKVCGVLVESTPLPPRRLVIGVGLNVNNRFSVAPKGLAETAISLAEETDRVFDRTRLLIDLTRQLRRHLSTTREPGYSLASTWRPHCFLSGRQVRVDAGTRPVGGLCEGVADDGALLLRSAEGVLERCYAGVVRDVS